MNAAVKIDCDTDEFFETHVIVIPGGNTPVRGCKKPGFSVKGCKWYLLKDVRFERINWCAIPDMTARALRKEISTAHSIEVEKTILACKSCGRVGGTRRNRKNGRNKRNVRQTRRN